MYVYAVYSQFWVLSKTVCILQNILNEYYFCGIFLMSIQSIFWLNFVHKPIKCIYLYLDMHSKFMRIRVQNNVNTTNTMTGVAQNDILLWRMKRRKKTTKIIHSHTCARQDITYLTLTLALCGTVYFLSNNNTRRRKKTAKY